MFAQFATDACPAYRTACPRDMLAIMPLYRPEPREATAFLTYCASATHRHWSFVNVLMSKISQHSRQLPSSATSIST